MKAVRMESGIGVRKRWGDVEVWMGKERKHNEITIVLTYKFHLSV